MDEFENIRKDFMCELKYLLKKYDAEITAKDHWIGYAECGEDVRMSVEFDDYRIDDIDLSSQIDGNEQ